MFRFYPFLLALWACLAHAPASVAQEAVSLPPAPVVAPRVDSEPAVALDELIRRALSNSPLLIVARENLEAARQRARAAGLISGPTLQVVPGFTGSEEARDEEVILSQPLDLFGQRRAVRAVRQAEARRATLENTLVQRSLVVSVKNAAATLFAAQEAEMLGATQVEIAQLFRAAAIRRAELGDVPPVQMQRAELELLRAQNEWEAARAERLSRRAELNQLIGQAPETPLRVALPHHSESAAAGPQPNGTPQTQENATAPAAAASTESTASTRPTESTTFTPSFAAAPSSPLMDGDGSAERAQLMVEAQNRPDIAGAAATLDARRAQIRVLQRERLPQIEVQARRDSVSSGGSTALRAVITMPLFDFGANKRERRALEAEARAQEAQIVLLRAQAATQVEQALIRLMQQRSAVARYRSAIVPQTLDLLRKTQIGYAAGASTYLEVLEAQRTLRQVQTEYLQALVGVRTSETALESATGASLPSGLAGTLVNPPGPSTPPGVAAPGTVLPDTIPPVESPVFNPPSITLPSTDLSVPNKGGELP